MLLALRNKTMPIEAPTQDPTIKTINPITIRVSSTPVIFTGVDTVGGSAVTEGKGIYNS